MEIEMPGIQTIRTVIAILRSDCDIGNDGTTRQTPEVCLTRTKSFFVRLNEYIQYVVYQISKEIVTSVSTISSPDTREAFR